VLPGPYSYEDARRYFDTAVRARRAAGRA